MHDSDQFRAKYSVINHKGEAGLTAKAVDKLRVIHPRIAALYAPIAIRVDSIHIDRIAINSTFLTIINFHTGLYRDYAHHVVP